MPENKSQQAIDKLPKKLKKTDLEAQARLLAKIIDEMKQFIRKENIVKAAQQTVHLTF